MNTYFGFKAFSNSFGLGIFLPQLVTETIPFLDRFFLENLRKLTHLFSIDCGIVHRSERQPFFFFLFFFFFSFSSSSSSVFACPLGRRDCLNVLSAEHAEHSDEGGL